MLKKNSFRIGMGALAVAIIAMVYLSTPLHVFAVSADVAFGGLGQEVECDSTQRTATKCAGYSIMNKSTNSVWVDLSAGSVVTSSGSTSIECQTNVSIKLPASCSSFTFKTSAGTSYLIVLAP